MESGLIFAPRASRFSCQEARRGKRKWAEAWRPLVRIQAANLQYLLMFAARKIENMQEVTALLNCRRLPGRLNTTETALLLGFSKTIFPHWSRQKPPGWVRKTRSSSTVWLCIVSMWQVLRRIMRGFRRHYPNGVATWAKKKITGREPIRVGFRGCVITEWSRSASQ